MIGLNTIWEVRHPLGYPGASDYNGGGYTLGGSGTDWTQQNSPKYILSGLSGVVGDTLWCKNTSLDMINNIIYCSGGFNCNVGGRHQILSVLPNSITFSQDYNGNSISTGSASGVTLVLGGALSSPGAAAEQFYNQAGMVAWVKYYSSPYLITVPDIGSNGVLCSIGGGLGQLTGAGDSVIGYDQQRGDVGNRPVIKWSGPDQDNPLFLTASINLLQNLFFDGNNGVNVNGSAVGGVNNCVYVNFSDFVNQVSAINTVAAVNSFVSGCYIGAVSAPQATNCIFYDCTYGVLAPDVNMTNVIAKNCDCGLFIDQYSSLYNCGADNCISGISYLSTATVCPIINCLTTNCDVGYIVYDYENFGGTMWNCAQYNCRVAVSGTTLINANFINVPNNPFEGDYKLNGDPNGGGLLRGKGLGIFGQETNIDIGATQHVYKLKVSAKFKK